LVDAPSYAEDDRLERRLSSCPRSSTTRDSASRWWSHGMFDDHDSPVPMESEESSGGEGESRRRQRLGKLCWKKSKSSKRWRPVAEALLDVQHEAIFS
jgi:hypothetical protein